MKVSGILKNKKGMAAELVAISLMVVFTVLSVSAVLTANSVLTGIKDDYSEEQAKIYAITFSQALEKDINKRPDVYNQYAVGLAGEQPTQLTYIAPDAVDAVIQPGTRFDLTFDAENSKNSNTLITNVTTKVTYRGSSYSVEKTYKIEPDSVTGVY